MVITVPLSRSIFVSFWEYSPIKSLIIGFLVADDDAGCRKLCACAPMLGAAASRPKAALLTAVIWRETRDAQHVGSEAAV